MAQILDFNKYIEDEDYLPDHMFIGLKEHCSRLLKTNDVWYLVGCIYELFQEYIISAKQEEELYRLVDPKEQFNNCRDYYEQIDKNLLMEFLKCEH